MSLNRRGTTTSRGTNPGAAILDRKGKRPHPHPPAPTHDTIEITSDDDEDPRPPPKRVFTRSENPPANLQDYEARLAQKDQEIEKLRKVRCMGTVCSCFDWVIWYAEGKGARTPCCRAKRRN